MAHPLLPQALLKSLPQRNFLALAFLGSLLMTSCGSPPPASTGSAPPNPAAGVAKENAAPSANPVANNSPGNPTVAKPQLVKTANLEIVVESVEAGIKQVNGLVREQQGDILSLEDNQTNSSDRSRAVLQVRVPQEKLDLLLENLAKLGTVRGRNLNSDDVSNQLVDAAARLKNLRKTEAALLEIMNRSGSVADVLKVAQELSNVRQAIEQIDAQLQNLQSQVAYSKVTISLQSLATKGSTAPALDLQLRETWQQATSSLWGLTTGLIKLLLWLLVYSPYLGLLWLAIYSYKRWLYKPRVPRVIPPEVPQD